MQGAFETGVYPNRFAAFGHGEAQVRQRLDEVFQQMFYGPEDVRLYHPAGEGIWAIWRIPATMTCAPKG